MLGELDRSVGNLECKFYVGTRRYVAEKTPSLYENDRSHEQRHETQLASLNNYWIISRDQEKRKEKKAIL